jgi:hypothetical protein
VTFDQKPPERLIWASRGRTWGFRFLLDGGLPDPLPEYERATAHLGDEPKAWHFADGRGALRFPDPDGRRDAAGRLIPHEFVVFGDLASSIRSAAEGQDLVWHLVSTAYGRVWTLDAPPSAADLYSDG